MALAVISDHARHITGSMLLYYTFGIPLTVGCTVHPGLMTEKPDTPRAAGFFHRTYTRNFTRLACTPDFSFHVVGTK